ncbi:MAG: zinc metalloprotease HtpX [Endomicrobiales bacterium]|nr:zinc metalloprotease HtpX [Endomicrobiales bacterium]
MNTLKSFILMLALTLLLVWIGQMLGGRDGMIYALIFAGVMNFVSYWFSDKIVLMMYRAKPLSENENPKIFRMMEELTRSAKIPMPKLYVIETNMPNAFATGRDPQHAAVAFTRGILNLLNTEELAGVAAHELSHVKNRDILISTIAATLAGAIFVLARMAQFAAIFGGGRGSNGRDNAMGNLAVAIVAPIAAMLIQMAISRSREYIADESGAKISGKPLALASALRKLHQGVQTRPASVNPTTAHMFIVHPFSGKTLMKIFSTHPPVEERVKRLEKMAEEASGYSVPNVIR